MNKEVREWRKQRALENPQTPKQFINAGKAIEVDGMYLTDNDKIIYAEYGNHLRGWRTEGGNYLYRNFFEAYWGLEY